jgi:Flp pilus assembly protein TadG
MKKTFVWRQNRGVGRSLSSTASRMNPRECARRAAHLVYAFLLDEGDGNALVELAFVAPIIMIMLTGVASFSMALYNYQQLGYAVSSAAQQVGAQQGLITDPCASLESDVTSALPGWTVSKFTFTTTITNQSGSATTFGPLAGTAFTCTSGAGDMAQNEPMTVTVSYQYSWFSILTWRPNSTFTPSGNLTVSESVLVE